MNEELDAMQAEAAAIDLEAAPATLEAAPLDAPAAVMPVDPVESLAGALSLIGLAAGYGGFPKAASIWTPDTCRALADKAVPVLAKYPWGLRVLNFIQTGAGVEELALLVVAAPLLLNTVSAVREDMKPATKPATPLELEPAPA